MDFFTHLLIAALIGIFSLNSLPLSVLIYACIMAFLADFDIILEPLRKVFKSNLLAHKGISHSIFYSALISALLGIIFSIITGISFLISWLVGFLFYDLHIFLDFLTASKIPLFYPFTTKRYRFFIDRAINFYLALISGSFILCTIIVFFFWQDFFFTGFLYIILTTFYFVYFIFRILVKIIIVIKYPKNHKFIPGITLFSYLKYVRTETEDYIKFELYLKNLFKKKKYLVQESILLVNSPYTELYYRALNLLKQFPFGEKWIYYIPTFRNNEKEIILDFFFAESYFKGHFYSIRLTFGIKTYEILELSDGFNRRHPNSIES